MLYQLTFCSRVSKSLLDNDIIKLLETEYLYCTKHNITGCSIYYQGEFVQILEGTEEEVLKLYTLIEEDNRHSFMVAAHKGFVPERCYANWTTVYDGLIDKKLFKLKNHLNIAEFHTYLNSLTNTNESKTMFEYLSKVILEETVS